MRFLYLLTPARQRRFDRIWKILEPAMVGAGQSVFHSEITRLIKQCPETTIETKRSMVDSPIEI